MRKFAVPALAIAIAAAAASITGCARTTNAEARTTMTSDLPTVAVARVESADLSHGIVLTAEFKPYQEVDVMAKVAGFVKKINVDIGDRVKAGQLLATLEVPEMQDDLNRADAAVERAQADVVHAQDELARANAAHEIADLNYKRLSRVVQKEPGLVAQQDIDDARSKDLVAEAQISAANSAVAAANEQVRVNQADVAKIKTLMEYTRVTAPPFDGVVTKRYADDGSMIQAATSSQTQVMPLVRLSQNNLLRLILPVPESAVPSVRIGQPVDVKVPSLNRGFPGKVVRFADKLSLETRTMDTEVDVANPTLVLVPGMYAEVNLTLAQRSSVLAVPVTAVDVDSSEPKVGGVMVVTHDNRIEPRKIQLGLETANRIEVRSGLNEGDMVVIGSRSGLQPGAEVRPKVTTIGGSGS
jgi:RND family efflux transporter MFP subunit